MRYRPFAQTGMALSAVSLELCGDDEAQAIERPAEFFTQLSQTNRLLFDIAQLSHSVHFVQPLKYPHTPLGAAITLDGVHFTASGHRRMYEVLKPYADCYLANRP